VSLSELLAWFCLVSAPWLKDTLLEVWRKTCACICHIDFQFVVDLSDNMLYNKSTINRTKWSSGVKSSAESCAWHEQASVFLHSQLACLTNEQPTRAQTGITARYFCTPTCRNIISYSVILNSVPNPTVFRCLVYKTRCSCVTWVDLFCVRQT